MLSNPDYQPAAEEDDLMIVDSELEENAGNKTVEV